MLIRWDNGRRVTPLGNAVKDQGEWKSWQKTLLILWEKRQRGSSVGIVAVELEWRREHRRAVRWRAAGRDPFWGRHELWLSCFGVPALSAEWARRLS